MHKPYGNIASRAQDVMLANMLAPPPLVSSISIHISPGWVPRDDRTDHIVDHCLAHIYDRTNLCRGARSWITFYFRVAKLKPGQTYANLTAQESMEMVLFSQSPQKLTQLSQLSFKWGNTFVHREARKAPLAMSSADKSLAAIMASYFHGTSVVRMCGQLSAAAQWLEAFMSACSIRS
ncbi:uncharacterized protein BJ212DRAFT_1303004 [Suillus subaureus]|uniref:Uncharacterized protein n=1 Tax=Suillus subaureus TaxID=48587 RepID=A0A9P7J8Q2_9AGAM|nr:uncharacterized protein BJ212DRAFT_1303004 [Suillus subaureus]KAG1808378.1 hypothetical protein BJ212DRAFT_1303004 [Suillus subaureus]